MHGQQNDKYTEMHGQQNDKYTEMHGQQNVKKKFVLFHAGTKSTAADLSIRSKENVSCMIQEGI